MNIEELMDENDRLKAEVERLTNCKSEADRLKAEVERLRAGSFVTAVPVEQYERLRKAGDVMCEVLEEIAKREGLFGFMSAKEWNAAKEGKQS